MKIVRFSQHALDKLDLLAKRGFTVTQAVVIETLQFPDKVESNKHPPIAQRRISERLVLRVVFTEDEEGLFVVTFYPAERRRYED
jgi:hypothetical protein